MRGHRTQRWAGLAAAGMVAVGVTGAAEANVQGWDIGWNDMATISGGDVSFSVRESGALEYVQIERAQVDFATYELFPGGDSWADITGDANYDQFFFDGVLRNAWFDDAVPEETAYDYWGEPADSYEWLVNDYDSPPPEPGDTPKNSFIRGTDSAFTYDDDTGEFVVDMTSTGTWHWTSHESPMSGWIQGFDWDDLDPDGDFAEYHHRYMTGQFRLVGTFEEDAEGLPILDNATLQYQVVPLPAAAWAGLAVLGAMGGVQGVRRKLRGRDAMA